MIRTAALAAAIVLSILIVMADIQRYEFEQSEREQAEQIASQRAMRWNSLDDAGRKMVAFDRIGK